jgi:acetyl-CoA acetyltransferase
VPFGAQSAANWVAMMAMRHFHEFGTTREQLAAIALNERANVARNPKAILREALTIDDYLAARMISDQLSLYDCDIPIDGSTAVVVSARETARDLPNQPIKIDAIGCGLRGRPSWDQFDDLTTMAARNAAAMLWSRTDLKPGDVDIALPLRRLQLPHDSMA